VGLGGGFVIVPVLRIALGMAPTTVAGTSLLFVLANVASSAVGYLQQKRVDLALALPLGLGAIPGGIAGVVAVKYVNDTWFDSAYALLLLVLAVLVMRRRAVKSRAEGERTFAHRAIVAVPAGVVLGALSSMFGIGGGIVMIPLFLIAARMPPHVVAATTSVIVALTAPIGVAAHALAGDIDWIAAVPLVIGGLVGGAFAPVVAQRVSSPRLITLLAYGLVAAAAGLALRHVV
jgi:uncharacterized membrane protein YfcA